MWILIIPSSLVILLIAAYLWLVMPRLTHRADMTALCVDYAHRGLWNDEHPENSLSAADLAIKKGYGIELDVQLSSDGVIMVFHDYSLTRMCGESVSLSSLSAEELQEKKLGRSSECIPTFDNFLELVNGRVPLLIELKSEAGYAEASKLCKAVAERLDLYEGPFAIQSFNPFALKWFKENRPKLARGQLLSKMTKKNTKQSFPKRFLLSNLLCNIIARPDFISSEAKHLKNLSVRLCISLFKAHGFAWTVRSNDIFESCRKRGVNSIFEKIVPKNK